MNDNSEISQKHRRNLYGLRSGRSLRPGQRYNLSTRLPRINPVNFVSENSKCIPEIDLNRLFGCNCPIWLEIGFGGGEHLIHQAITYPDIGLIGCEVYKKGIATAIGSMLQNNVENLRIFPGDVRDLCDILPSQSIARAFLLHPDPWPKKRHHRRRFVNREYLDPIARVMMQGAMLRIATDIPDYVRQTMEQLSLHPDFEWHIKNPKEWKNRWFDAIQTRYEHKASKSGRQSYFLTFIRT